MKRAIFPLFEIFRRIVPRLESRRLTTSKLKRRLKAVAASVAVSSVVFLGAVETAEAGEWAEWIAFTQMEFFHIDNINNSPWQFDEEKTDGVWTALLSLGRIYQLGESTRLSATTDFSHQLHNEFRRLDNSRVGGSLTLSKKLGLGPSTPWIQGGFSVANTFSRSDVRDGQVYSASVRLGKRIAERVDLDLGYTFDLSDLSEFWGAPQWSRVSLPF